MGTTKSSRYGHSINIDLDRWQIWQYINGWGLEIVEGWDEVTEFKVVSKGWTVEPTLAGLDRYCRWSKNSKIWLAQVKIWFILLWYNSCWSELPSTQLRALRHSLRACLINWVDTDSPMYPISETISIYCFSVYLISADKKNDSRYQNWGLGGFRILVSIPTKWWFWSGGLLVTTKCHSSLVR